MAERKSIAFEKVFADLELEGKNRVDHPEYQYYQGLRYKLRCDHDAHDGDYENAYRWFRLAASQNHSASQYELGIMYLYGKGLTCDETAALGWFRMALQNDEGNHLAMHQLGIMHRHAKKFK